MTPEQARLVTTSWSSVASIADSAIATMTPPTNAFAPSCRKSEIAAAFVMPAFAFIAAPFRAMARLQWSHWARARWRPCARIAAGRRRNVAKR